MNVVWHALCAATAQRQHHAVPRGLRRHRRCLPTPTRLRRQAPPSRTSRHADADAFSQPTLKQGSLRTARPTCVAGFLLRPASGTQPCPRRRPVRRPSAPGPRRLAATPCAGCTAPRRRRQAAAGWRLFWTAWRASGRTSHSRGEAGTQASRPERGRQACQAGRQAGGHAVGPCRGPALPRPAGSCCALARVASG